MNQHASGNDADNGDGNHIFESGHIEKESYVLIEPCKISRKPNQFDEFQYFQKLKHTENLEKRVKRYYCNQVKNIFRKKVSLVVRQQQSPEIINNKNNRDDCV